MLLLEEGRNKSAHLLHYTEAEPGVDGIIDTYQFLFPTIITSVMY